MYEWFYASVVVFVASVLQSITGSGFAIIAAPFLLILYNSVEGVQISILLSLLIAVALTPKIKHDIDYTILKNLIIGSIFGLPIGLLFFAFTSLNTIKLVIAIVVLALTVYSLARYCKTFIVNKEGKTYVKATDEGIIENTTAITKDNYLQSKRKPLYKELVIGFLSGVLTTSVNMPGVPTALYFNSGSFKNEVVRSTTLGFFIAVYSTGIIMQLLTVGISGQVFTLSINLAPAVVIGIFVGNYLFRKINRVMFQLITNVALLFMGLYVLQKSF